MYSKDEAKSQVHLWVQKANETTSNTEPYTEREAKATLTQVYKQEPREPWAAPTNDIGLTKELDDYLMASAHFARDAGGVLYVFKEGVYRPTGEDYIKCEVKAWCMNQGRTKSWNPELPSRVSQWIAADCPVLWERPPVDTLNCRNGLLDVHTRELRPHDPAFLSPVQIGVNFDPEATCPAIDRFVQDVFHQDSQHVPFELAGWLMLPNTSIQKAVLTLGAGANGKSVFLALLQRFLDSTNVSALSLHKIESDKFAAARLAGKLANICPDLPTAALSGTSMFKGLTGGDTINAEHKFQASFEFRPYSRLVFSANSAPRSDDSTHGFFRRWIVIPFSRVFDENSSDAVPRAVLDARLSTPGELSGMLNRALDALPQVESGRVRDGESIYAGGLERVSRSH